MITRRTFFKLATATVIGASLPFGGMKPSKVFPDERAWGKLRHSTALECWQWEYLGSEQLNDGGYKFSFRRNGKTIIATEHAIQEVK